MPEYVRLDPNYENVIKFLGVAILNGQHEKPALAIYSILDQMRFLTETDLPAARRVVEYFKDLSDRAYPDMAGGEDEHLEADYEDRYGYPDLDD